MSLQLLETEPEKLPAMLDAARDDGIDLAIIDTRPSAGADAAQVATLSHLVVVPARPAILDLRALWRIVEKELSREKTDIDRRPDAKGHPGRDRTRTARSQARAAD